MRYVALVGDEERDVDITEVAPGQYRLVMDGRTMRLDARFISDSTLSLLHDDEAYTIESEKHPKAGETVLVRGHALTVEVLDLRTSSRRRTQDVASGPDGPAEITSPMPGKVVEVLVEEGDHVAEGQGLVVVEAMKMENELKSPRAGTVKNLEVEEGVAVDGGAVLCVVE
ncbi:MAG: biotin/lipoyl-containing protein [Myxococcota bacterium]